MEKFHKEHRVVIAGFTANELEQNVGVWTIQGYERQGDVEKEYISFRTPRNRTSYKIYLQILTKKIPTIDNSSTNE